MIHKEIYLGPPRWFTDSVTTKSLIVIHNTSNPNLASARQENAYSKTRPRENAASSQYYCDKIEVIQSLDTKLVAWHAGSSEGNTRGIAWEFTGKNELTREWWLANVAWDKAAFYIAADCREYAIPATLLTVAQARANQRGFITHDIARLAWGGTTHTDPGPGFPMDHLLAKVKQQLTGALPPMEENMFFSTDPKTGIIYASDSDLKDRWKVADSINDRAMTADYPYLAALGVVKLWSTSPRAEVKNYTHGGVTYSVWQSTGDGFGRLRPDVATPPVLVGMSSDDVVAAVKRAGREGTDEN